ncbi:unnamed protein product [Caenorhabditis auriculariae]|uniref:Uncharacterized protein n=1 Tax=Caenorhabditis auriculariae TaxID=2777116 RepID=A0A8S1HGR2_9PELO|nr:unnamed protein product [Caenorhabditis auriculariae]
MERPPSSRPKTSAGRAASARSRQPAPTNGSVPSGMRPPSRQTMSRMGTAMGNGNIPQPPPRSSLGQRIGSSAMQRVPTAMNDRPMTGMARPPSSAIRPPTQQGIAGLRAPTRMGTGSTRQVFDKTYYIGLLRSKINQLNVEIARLSEQKQIGDKDRAELSAYEARAQASALEIRDLQGRLIDLNVIIDRMHVNADMSDIELEARKMKEKADEMEADVQELVNERLAKEKEAEQLHAQIEEQKKLNEAVTTAMDPSVRERYDELKQESELLKKRVSEMEAQIEELEDRKAKLEMEVDGSPMKKKAVHLQETIAVLKDKLEVLEKEKALTETPEQKKEKLVEQMRQINQDIATIEKQHQQVREQIDTTSEELHEYDAHGGESQQLKNHTKYLELMVKDHQIDEMLRNYPKQYPLLQSELEEYSGAILMILRKISANVKKVDLGANITDIDEEGLKMKLRGNGNISELKDAHVRLQEELIMLGDMEMSLRADIRNLAESATVSNQKIQEYRREEETLNDTEHEVQQLEQKRSQLRAQEPELSRKVKDLKRMITDIRNELESLPNYGKIKGLEKKLKMLKESNAEKQAEIDATKAQTNYQPIKAEVLRMQAEYNAYLIANMAKRN